MQKGDHCPPQEWTAACLFPRVACVCPTTSASPQRGEAWCHAVETPLCKLHMQAGVSKTFVIMESPSPPLFFVLLMTEIKWLRTALPPVSSQQGKLHGNYYWKTLVQNKVNKSLLHLPRENDFHLLYHYKALLSNLASEEMISLPSYTNVLATGSGVEVSEAAFRKLPMFPKPCWNEPGYLVQFPSS